MKRAVPAILAAMFLCTSAFPQGSPESIGGGWLHSRANDGAQRGTQSVFTLGNVDKSSMIGFACSNTDFVSALQVRIPDVIEPAAAKGKALITFRETNDLEPKRLIVDTANRGRLLRLPHEYVAYLLTTQRVVIHYTNTSGKVHTVEFLNPLSPIALVRKECSNKDFLSFLDDMERIEKGLIASGKEH